MDFTYYVTFALSAVIGFMSALIFVILKGRSYSRFALTTLLVAVFAHFALLVDWSRVNEMTAALLLTDAAFFTAYGLAGCVIGALPVVGARGIYRLVRARPTE